MVQETPGTCNSWLWGPPSSVFSCGEGSGRPCLAKKISQKNKNNGTLKKESQLVQNGFQKPGYKSESKAQGQGVGSGRAGSGGWESGQWGHLACRLSAVPLGWRGVVEGPGRQEVLTASPVSRERVSPACSLGQRAASLWGVLLLKGSLSHQRLHSPGERDPTA